ncbi:hypothetical protein PHJA_001194000 [Phtheirospermum japonicum]|uniref:PRA1 family protein n=1 Tax=Phtheirospermum japonicum TaxID=374723 RepID=A0A830C8C3_9LAMI|nr:hypothetical protein PHJA_001194000 [Phtheirospermum japonicum]
MADYGTTTTQRPSSSSNSPTPQDVESKNPSKKITYTLTLSFPFNIPSTPESAAIRIVRNLEKFGLYYAILIWTALFISLVPRRKVSVIFLVSTTEVAFLYFLLLRACPSSAILHRIIDKRLVFFVLFVITAVMMILTHAAVHLFVVLAATIPIVMVHAVLSKMDDVIVKQADRGEMARLVQETLGDYDSHRQYEDMV